MSSTGRTLSEMLLAIWVVPSLAAVMMMRIEDSADSIAVQYLGTIEVIAGTAARQFMAPIVFMSMAAPRAEHGNQLMGWDLRSRKCSSSALEPCFEGAR